MFRLAWDYAGTALASRVELYERFYLTSGARNQQRAHQLAKRDSAMTMVERFLTEAVEQRARRCHSSGHCKEQCDEANSGLTSRLRFVTRKIAASLRSSQ